MVRWPFRAIRERVGLEVRNIKVLFIIVDLRFRNDDGTTKTEIVLVLNTDNGSFVRQVLI